MDEIDMEDGDIALFMYDFELFGRNKAVPIYFHVDHDNRRNYYTVELFTEEFRTVDEAKAFAKTYYSLVN